VRFRLTHVAILAIPFSAEPQTIAVSADPPLTIDVDSGTASDRLPLELVEQHERVQRAIVRRVTLDVGESCLSILVRDRWNEGWQLGGGLLFRHRLSWLVVFRMLRPRWPNTDGKGSKEENGS
jgi:hypothetical protein